MTLYTNTIKTAMRRQRSKLKSIERHKDIYPIIEELKTQFNREVYINQSSAVLTATIYLTKEDDKTLPLLIEETVFTFDYMEKREESQSNKGLGEITFYFQHKKAPFGQGEYPRLTLCVDYSSLCKRVKIGTKEVDDYVYKCT